MFANLKLNKVAHKAVAVSIVVLASPSLFAFDFICGNLNSDYIFIRNSNPAVVAGTEAKLQARIHIPSEKIMVAQYNCTKNGLVGEFAKRVPVKVISPVYHCEPEVSYLPTVRLELAYSMASENQGADAALMKLIPNKKIEISCKDLQ